VRFITSPLYAFLLSAGVTASASLFAAEGHDHHGHHAGHAGHGVAAKAGGATEVPPLRILYPQPGAKVGTQLAIVFETPGDMRRLTMSAAAIGTHLHIETDGISLMPVESQLIRLGEGHYVFVFDLPVQPGDRELRLYWSDGMHKTIDESVQSVKVTVATE
jgi:hypothetical protein